MGRGNFFRKLIRKAPSILGTVAGTTLLGPAGGIIGGGLGGAAERGKGNKLSGALNGALTAAAYQAIAPTLIDKIGLGSNPILSAISGLKSPSLLNQLGISSAPAMGGGLGLFGNAGNAGLLSNVPSRLISGLSGSLMKAAIQQPNSSYGQEEAYPAIEDYYNQTMPGRPTQHQGEGPGSFNLIMDRSSSRMSPLDILMRLSPNIPFSKYKRSERHHVQPSQRHEHEKQKPTAKFARGGLSKAENTGYIKESDSGGQDDDINMTIPDGAYVMNATDVSLLGDGSSENGVKKLKKFEEKFLRSGITKPYDSHAYGIKAKVSNDEYVLDPRTVNALGKGDNKKGAKVIDKMRNNLRKHKGVNKILPPKTKHLTHYMKGGR